MVGQHFTNAYVYAAQLDRVLSGLLNLCSLLEKKNERWSACSFGTGATGCRREE